MEQATDYNWTANTVTSSVGGIITAVIGITFWIIKNKCRHTTSKCNSGCFQCTSREDSERTERDAAFMREFQEYKKRQIQTV